MLATGGGVGSSSSYTYPRIHHQHHQSAIIMSRHERSHDLMMMQLFA
jgi:hypothetical protein